MAAEGTTQPQSLSSPTPIGSATPPFPRRGFSLVPVTARRLLPGNEAGVPKRVLAEAGRAVLEKLPANRQGAQTATVTP